MNKGFTLIETLIYIALLTFIMGAGVAAAYYLIDSSAKGKMETNTIAEAEFLLRKIDWVMTGADNINLALLPGKLSVDKYGFPSNPIRIDLDTPKKRARIAIAGVESYLTGDRVQMTGLEFIYIPPHPPRPAGIIASSTMNGRHFEITKYLRK